MVTGELVRFQDTVNQMLFTSKQPFAKITLTTQNARRQLPYFTSNQQCSSWLTLAKSPSAKETWNLAKGFQHTFSKLRINF